MLVSILEGHVSSEKWTSLEYAYRNGVKYIPPHLIKSFLIQDKNDKNVWRIIAEWTSEKEFEERNESQEILRSCADMFRNAGVEPTRRNFVVKAQHTRV
ncbi:MAG: hypothetical protein JEZ06_08235 [Anaerolineaceae bacterium]|nr:hypothetical protein [Anaerolineaceae bacterium]